MFAGNLHAQTDSTLQGFGIEANLIGGKVFKHSPKFTAPIPAFSRAFDLNFVWQTYGKRKWEQQRNFPMIGVGAVYTDYGNNAVFGRCVSIYPNIRFTLLHDERVEWTLMIGDGLGYVTRKYNRTFPIDTINTAIGSNVNDFAVLLTDLCYNINKHWKIQLGGNFMHISNANYHRPNLGVNMVGAHAGVQFFPVNSKPKPIVRDIPKLSNRWLGEIRVGVGFKEANATGNPEKPSYIISGYASKRMWSKDKLYAGIDYAYHESTYDFLKTYAINVGHEMGHSWDGTFFVGNEFILGDIGILTQVGYYYRLTYLRYGNDPLNEKFGLKYYLIKQERGILKEMFVSAVLTTHMAVAEYAEFGVGAGF